MRQKAKKALAAVHDWYISTDAPIEIAPGIYKTVVCTEAPKNKAVHAVHVVDYSLYQQLKNQLAKLKRNK